MIHKSRPKSFKNDDLYIICMVSNPCMYESRYHLFEQFEQHILEHTDNLWVAEIATGERTHQVTRRDHPQHIQLSAGLEGSIVWSKEAAWNLVAARLPREARYLCFLDADISFVNPNWIQDTLHQLQHFKLVQPFESAVNLGPTGAFLDTWHSVGYAAMHDQPVLAKDERGPYGSFYHPGFGVALRKETFAELGGWMTWPILGAGDHHQFMALLGRVQESYPDAIHENYKALCLEWQARAELHVRRNIGATPGTITHHFHGAFRNRRYKERWSILLEHGFDPAKDVKLDHQGLPQLTHAGMRMYQDLRRYHAQRLEDSQDLGSEAK